LAGLKISGLDTFGQRVLFAKVVPESDDLFWQFVGTVLVEILKNFFSLELKRRHDTQYNNSQHNDTQYYNNQHNDTEYNGLICDNQHNDTQYNGLICETQHNIT
jgi:hypothetical protein